MEFDRNRGRGVSHQLACHHYVTRALHTMAVALSLGSEDWKDL